MADKLSLAYKSLTELPVVSSNDITGKEQAVLYSPTLGGAVLSPQVFGQAIPFSVSVTVTQAQILTLTTTPVTIVPGMSPAPAQERAWVVTRWRIARLGSTAYTVPANSTFGLRINNTSGDLCVGLINANGFMDVASAGLERICTTGASYGPQNTTAPIVLTQATGTALTGTGGDITVQVTGYSIVKAIL